MFSIVVRKNGDKIIPKFPVILEAGEQFIFAKGETVVKVPEGHTWKIIRSGEAFEIVEPEDFPSHCNLMPCPDSHNDTDVTISSES